MEKAVNKYWLPDIPKITYFEHKKSPTKSKTLPDT